MDISVILISYNEAEYIEDSVRSVLTQKFYGEIEIVIADDGSDDDSIAVIERLEKENPKIIKHFISDRSDGETIPSLRISNNIKKAFTLCKGKYIAVLSGDDRFCSRDFFQESYEFLECHKGLRYAAVFTDYRYSFSESATDFSNRVFNNYAFRALMIAKNYTHISTFLIRREVFRQYLLDRFCDDTGMMFSICTCGKIKHIGIIGFDYRQRSDSIMHRSDILELGILELMLFQDFLNSGRYRLSAFSRVYHNLAFCFKHRNKLSNPNYSKYLEDSQLHDNNFLGLIADYNGLSLILKGKVRFALVSAFLGHILFGCIRVLSSTIYILNRRIVRK